MPTVTVTLFHNVEHASPAPADAPTTPVQRQAEVEVTGLLHAGARNLVFTGRLAGQACVLKVPRLEAQAASFTTGDHATINFYAATTRHDLAVRARPGVERGSDLPPMAAQLLWSEFETLRHRGPAWNAQPLGFGDDPHNRATFEALARAAQLEEGAAQTEVGAAQPQEGATGEAGVAGGLRLADVCMVAPLFAGGTIGQLPEADRARLWLRCLPSLWDALSGRPHGDLNPGNVILSEAHTHFHLIDPSAACHTSFEHDAPGLLTRHRSETVYTTTPAFYPLHYPLDFSPQATWGFGHGQSRPGETPYSFAQEAKGQRLLKFSCAESSRPLPLTPAYFQIVPDRPTPADACALGLISYHLLTGDTLILPDLIDQPAWELSSITTFPVLIPPTARRDALLKTCTEGYLEAKLSQLGTQSLADLIARLILGQIDTRAQIEAALAGG